MLNNVKSGFVPNEYVAIKCGFSLENIQPVPIETSVPISSFKYLSTDIYHQRYFNDSLFLNLKNDIKKRTISNGKSGMSWIFRRFIYINLKIHSEYSLLMA